MKKFLGCLGAVIGVLGLFVTAGESTRPDVWQYWPFVIGVPMMIVGGGIAYYCWRNEGRRKPLPRYFSATEQRRWGR